MVADDGTRQWIPARLAPAAILPDDLGVIFNEPVRQIDFAVAVEPPVVIFGVPLADERVGVAEVHTQVTRPVTRDATIAVQVGTSDTDGLAVEEVPRPIPTIGVDHAL